MSGNYCCNTHVFILRQISVKEEDDWISWEKRFQRMDAATGNERRSTVARRYAGTCSRRDDDERMRWRSGRSAIRTSWTRIGWDQQTVQCLKRHDRNFIVDTLWYTQPVEDCKKMYPPAFYTAGTKRVYRQGHSLLRRQSVSVKTMFWAFEHRIVLVGEEDEATVTSHAVLICHINCDARRESWKAKDKGITRIARQLYALPPSVTLTSGVRTEPVVHRRGKVRRISCLRLGID